MDMLTPLKIRIGIKENGHAAYPDFGDALKVLGINENWSHYVDRFGGWHYDCCGHQESEPDSPVGMQWGMLMVPKEFAEQAVELFPDVCECIDEPACEKFYNERVTRDQPEHHEDLEELQAIVALEALGEDVTDRKWRALDPDDPARGRRRNKRKTWQQYKVQRGIEVDNASIGLLSERRRYALEARRNGNAPDAVEPVRP